MTLKDIYHKVKDANFDDAVDILLDLDQTLIQVDIDTRSMCIILSDRCRNIKMDYTFSSKQKIAAYSTEDIGEDTQIVQFRSEG